MDGPCTVAVMEHRDLVRVGLVHTLEVAGNNTVALAVASGGDLLGALRTGLAVELVLVEMELPEMNGFAVLAQLRERHEAVRVLMMGHRPGGEPLRRAIRQGAFTVLCIDCCEADLLKAVHDVQLTGNHFSRAMRCELGLGPKPREEARRPVDRGSAIAKVKVRMLGYWKLYCTMTKPVPSRIGFTRSARSQWFVECR